jgi:hypothetical protein
VSICEFLSVSEIAGSDVAGIRGTVGKVIRKCSRKTAGRRKRRYDEITTRIAVPGAATAYLPPTRLLDYSNA